MKNLPFRRAFQTPICGKTQQLGSLTVEIFDESAGGAFSAIATELLQSILETQTLFAGGGVR